MANQIARIASDFKVDVINMKIFFHVCNLIKSKSQKYNRGFLACFMFVYQNVNPAEQFCPV